MTGDGGWHQGSGESGGEGDRVKRFQEENFQDLLGGGTSGVRERRVQGSQTAVMGTLGEEERSGEGVVKMMKSQKALGGQLVCSRQLTDGETEVHKSSIPFPREHSEAVAKPGPEFRSHMTDDETSATVQPGLICSSFNQHFLIP